MTWALVFAAIRCSWKSDVWTTGLAGIFIIEQQGPGTSRNVCGVLSVFIYGHLLNCEAAPPWDRQDRTGVAFIVESSGDFHWVIAFD